MLSLLVRILKTEGLTGAFKGFGANMINTFSMRQSRSSPSPQALTPSCRSIEFAYFFFHTLLRNTTLKRLSRSSSGARTLSTSAELLIGALAGAFAQVFTIPVAVIATRQQLYVPPPPSPSAAPLISQAPSLFDTAKEIIAESGPTGLWTGLRPGLVLTVNPAITYGVFERVKSWTLSRNGRGGVGKLSVGEAFWLGVGSKMLATIVTYPYIFVSLFGHHFRALRLMLRRLFRRKFDCKPSQSR